VELVYAIAAFETAGNLRGDRIEHLSIASPELVARVAALGLHACVQPHFIAERGDRYLAEVEPQHFADLYRLRSLHLAGIPLAGGSDAPYGSADPWSAMRAAVARTSPSGVTIGADEALSPEQAVALYLADPLDLPRTRRIAVGEPADLCLLDRPWTEARTRLLREDVRATLVAGRLVHQRVDEAPVERAGRTQAPA
jgi:predicted amidohydrolase YtcJ